MSLSIAITAVSLAASISGIVFAFLAFKRSERQDQKSAGKNEGFIMSDIGYIKACVDRMEKNLTSVDERYRNLVERLAKVEEGLLNAEKRMDDILLKEG